MKKNAIVYILLSMGSLMLPDFSAGAKQDKLPRMPGAALLVGYAPRNLFLTGPKETVKVQESQESRDGLVVDPSISRDGKIIASGRVVKADYPRTILIQTYSTMDRKWTGYKEIAGGGAIVISPDGSKMAFAAEDEIYGRPFRIHFIDLATKVESVSPIIGPYAGRTLSWSPDGRRIAYEMNESPFFHKPEICILEIESGRITKIANGAAPAWSPSGEWIAYFDNSKGWKTSTQTRGSDLWYIHPQINQLAMIGPDGTGYKTLATGKEFMGAPVWSPDSTQILLNELSSFSKFTMNIHIMELSTLKLTRKFRDTPIVYAWAEAK